MSLAKPRRASHAKSPSEAVEQTPATEKPTLASAVAHLESLTPYVKELLAGEKLRVELGELNTMQGRTNRANVMWVGPPKEGEHETRLRAVAEFVSNAFKSAGFLVDEDRRLTLHCTVINTLYRKPRQKPRGFFAYTSILTSDALRGIALDPDALIAPAAGPFTNSEPKGTGAGTSAHGHKGKARERGSDPVRIDLGMWDIDEVQICEMGSHGPDGEYVCVGRIALD